MYRDLGNIEVQAAGERETFICEDNRAPVLEGAVQNSAFKI